MSFGSSILKKNRLASLNQLEIGSIFLPFFAFLLVGRGVLAEPFNGLWTVSAIGSLGTGRTTIMANCC